MRNIEIVEKIQREEMREILNEYLIELSKFDKDIEFAQNGKPIYKWFDCYFEEKSRYPIYLKVDNKIAGMSLIRKLDDKLFEVAEFYVRPDFRKDGNAIWFANTIINLFDGDFEFSTCLTNQRAKMFWDKFSTNFNTSSLIDDERKNWKIKK